MLKPKSYIRYIILYSYSCQFERNLPKQGEKILEGTKITYTFEGNLSTGCFFTGTTSFNFVTQKY